MLLFSFYFYKIIIERFKENEIKLDYIDEEELSIYIDSNYFEFDTKIMLLEDKELKKEIEKIKEKIFKEKAPNAEEIFIYKELMQEFKTYSEKHFSELEKKVLRYLIKGYSYGEIAQILKKSNKTIDNTYQRIKLKVKKWLKSLNNI
ncbi:MAG: LuxR C-terminal-related transcriptional regulator [Fusobacterium sp.]